VDDHDPAVPLEYKTAEAHRQPRISPDERNRLRQVSFNNGDKPVLTPQGSQSK
jgi:hypothetical protein